MTSKSGEVRGGRVDRGVGAVATGHSPSHVVSNAVPGSVAQPKVAEAHAPQRVDARRYLTICHFYVAICYLPLNPRVIDTYETNM